MQYYNEPLISVVFSLTASRLFNNYVITFSSIKDVLSCENKVLRECELKKDGQGYPVWFYGKKFQLFSRNSYAELMIGRLSQIKIRI